MKPSYVGAVAGAIALATAACQTGPISPTIIPTPPVPQVATTRPNVWDSREELAAWVNNGVSTGSATVVGEGADAFIRVDSRAGNAKLHGPTFNPPLAGVPAARLRYRLVNNAPGQLTVVFLYLRPVTFDDEFTIPTFGIEYDLLRRGAGDWIEDTMKPWFTAPMPDRIQVQFAVLEVHEFNRVRGVLDIDSIALLP